MKRELGIARCGLACCLCSENISCQGCNSGQCPDKDWCENRKCSLEKGHTHCYTCSVDCKKGLLSKIKPYGFTQFASCGSYSYILEIGRIRPAAILLQRPKGHPPLFY